VVHVLVDPIPIRAITQYQFAQWTACVLLLEMASAQYRINGVARLLLYSCFSLGRPYPMSSG